MWAWLLSVSAPLEDWLDRSCQSEASHQSGRGDEPGSEPPASVQACVSGGASHGYHYVVSTLTCPMCNAISSFTIAWSGQLPDRSPLRYQPTGNVLRDLDSRSITAVEVVALRCSNDVCGAVIGGVRGSSGQILRHWPVKMVERKVFPDVPDHIAQAASEAHLVHDHGAHRAAAVLARAVVEATAKEKGYAENGIRTKIDEMYRDRVLREHIKDAAHEVRHLGNEMAHGDFVDAVLPEESAVVLQLMDEVLDEVFQSPARVKRVREAREAKMQE